MKKTLTKTFAVLLLMMSCWIPIHAQSVINGTVKDATGEGLPGVNVLVQDKEQGTITNVDGEFAVQAENGDVLVFSFVGFITQKATVLGAAIDIVLEEDVLSLEEVVVTALGIKRKRKAIGYAMTNVKGDDLSRVKTTSAINALQGRVAGVNVSTNSSGASGSSRIIIRGASSLTDNNQPLYVIDGMPMLNNTNGSVVGAFGGEHGDGGNDISTINPDDIESISVLKGSSASALYGSLASNGVIMITTKSGRGQDKLGIEFSSSLTFDKVNTSLMDIQNTYGSGRDGLRPGFELDGSDNPVEITDAVLATTDAYNESLSSWGALYDGSSVYNWDGQKRPYSYTGDNIDKFFNTGVTAVNTIALSKGGDDYSYRLSYTNLDNEDIFPNTTLKRNTVSLSASANVNPKIVATTKVSYSREKVHNRVTIGDTPGNANTIVWLLPGSLDINDLKGANGDGSTDSGTELRHQTSQFRTNPFWVANHFNNDDLKERLVASATLKYDLTDWLYVLGRFGMDTYGLSRRQVTPLGTAYRPSGILTQSESTNTLFNTDVMLGIDKALTDKLSLISILGGSARNETLKFLSAKGSNFIDPNLEDLGNTTLPVPFNDPREKKTNSLYGSVELDYFQTVFLTLTGRNDWFSTLSFPGKTTPNNEFYWSLSSSLLINEVIDLPEAIDFLKVRTSYAQVAGGAQQAYALNLNYAITGSFQGQSFGNLNANAVPNADLVPFQKSEFEIGLDAKLLSNRLYVDFSYYSNNTVDDIVTAAASSASGYTAAILNNGELSNTGVEFLIGGTPIEKSNFTWNTSFNVGYNNGKIVATDDANTPINIDGSQTRTKTAIISHIVGENYGVIFGSSYERDAAGKIVYDLSGSVPKPVQGENKILGKGVAPLTLGFYNELNYKSFALSFLVDGKFGGSVHSGTNLALTSNGLHQNTIEGRDGGLVISGVDQADGTDFTVTIPEKDIRFYYGNLGAENVGIAEEFIYSTDFIKFRELSLSYSLPKALVEKVSLGDVRISVIGRNLFFLHKEADNIDPEASLNNLNSQGIERFGIPATRSLGFSLNLKF